MAHIDHLLVVSDEDVVHDASLCQVPKLDHVLHTICAGHVHELDAVLIPTRIYPMLLNQKENKAFKMEALTYIHLDCSRERKRERE